MDQQKEEAPPVAKHDEPEPPHVMCRERWKRIQAQAQEAKQQK
ncbi:hypothetical protein [Massilia sp. TN1-12]